MIEQSMFPNGTGRDLAKDPILSCDPRWKTNADMIADLSLLGWLDGEVLDMTYGEGKFWSKYRPELLAANDLNPDKGDLTLDWTKESFINAFDTEGFDAVVFDPPYKLQGKPSGVGSNNRYGVDVRRSVQEIHELFVLGIYTGEQLVAKGGYFMIKCQAQQALKSFHNQPMWVHKELAGRDGRFIQIAQFTLLNQPPPQTTQITPRNNGSQLLVFQRDNHV